jgi:hypothetical protein
MRGRKRLTACLLVLAATVAAPAPCPAQVPAGLSYRYQVSYRFDGYGNYTAVLVRIQTSFGGDALFLLPGALLQLPLEMQLIALDQQVGLGIHAAAVAAVLVDLQNAQAARRLRAWTGPRR